MRVTRKKIIWSIVSVIVAIAGGELFARFALGLGSPPLTVSHPRIEYMFKPNQDVYRFGNHFVVNQYGMRTEPFPTKKENDEFRIMVFGDSVINGGNLTDHADLATSLLRERLLEVADGKNVVVGNISAHSWGPGNWLAYAREYGFFDADVVVVVISSHDYADNPDFQPLSMNTHPTERPISALLEGIERYLPRYLPRLGSGDGTRRSDPFLAEANERDAQEGLDDLKSFLELAQEQSGFVLVLQHWDKLEVESGTAGLGNEHIKAVCEQLGITPISLALYFRQSVDKGANPFRDGIHPNNIGQELIAQAIFENMPNEALQRTR